MNWYALHTKPHKEFSVYELLLLEDFETYFPFIKVQPKNPRSAKRRPYYPGYIFVRLELAHLGINALKWMPGTNGLISFGNIPAIVPDYFISQLRKQMRTIEVEGLPLGKRLKHGDNVAIVDGPFAGHEAIFDSYLPSKDRVRILLAFLSTHPQPITLDQESIEKRSQP